MTGAGPASTSLSPSDAAARPQQARAFYPPLFLKELMNDHTYTILIVDDNADVQGFLSHLLRSTGYRVLEAYDARQALRLCQDYPEPIHLLVTDVQMPEMDGRDLAIQASALRETMAVLFISGFVGNAKICEEFSRPTVAFLQKPFKPDALLRKVQELLRP